MTPTLRTAILDALMERWRNSLRFLSPDPFAYAAVFKARMALEEPTQRTYFASCLDMILPVAEPMIREAALREAAAEARKCASTYRRHPTSPPSNVDILNRGRTSASYETADACAVAILALGEPK